MLQQVTPAQANRELILVYGAPGAGKTRFVTSLPDRFGKIAYVAADEGSESLASVLPQYRSRITVFKPDWKDPLVEAAEIYLTDWKKKGFDTLEIETFTRFTFGWLDEIVAKGLFQEKRNTVGTPGKPGFIALPDKGHYGGVHAVIRNFITNLINQQPEMNILLTCHQALNDSDEKGHVIGGPALTGRAMIEWLPARFSTVIRLDRMVKPVLKGGKMENEVKILARMAPHGAWIARRNESGAEGNPLPVVELDVDPINFWTAYDNTRPGKEKA